MTELEQFEEFAELLISLGNRLAYTLEPGNLKNNTLKYLNNKYRVTLRNNDSTADNNKVEQSITDEELMSKIEDMAFYIAWVNSSYFHEMPFKVEFKQQLKDLFKTHRNNFSTAINKKDDDSVDENSLKAEIRSLLLQYNYEFKHTDYAIETIEKKLLELFKTNRNTVFKADNEKVNNLITEIEIYSKIEFMALENSSSSFKWNSEITMNENQFEKFVKELTSMMKNLIKENKQIL